MHPKALIIRIQLFGSCAIRIVRKVERKQPGCLLKLSETGDLARTAGECGVANPNAEQDQGLKLRLPLPPVLPEPEPEPVVSRKTAFG